jgi:hypothetical protein
LTCTIKFFAHHFEGADLPDMTGVELEDLARSLLEQWLQDPKTIADALGVDEADLQKLTPEELIAYFKERLKEQTGRHDGGNRWIGTRRHVAGGPLRVSSGRHAGGGDVPQQVGGQGGHGAPLQGLFSPGAADPLHDGRGPQALASPAARRTQGPGQRG